VNDRSRRGGSALAVDLRRARAARRREEKAAETAATPPQPKPARPSPTIVCGDRDPIDCVREWFNSEGWEPFEFQEEVWRAYLAGESGLIHAATGTGKTYAAWMGPILDWLRDYPAGKWASREAGRLPGSAPPLRVLWITPLRALAADTEAALRAPIEDLGLPWTVESRTGDSAPRV
jgi:ATP-dependent Lhr-like helicase